MALSDEILKLTPSGMVELFEIDFTPLGGTLVRFCNGKNFNNQDVIWKGNVYQARAIEAKGFHRDAQGRIPRPKVTMSNVAGIVTELIKSLGGDVTGVRFTRRRTLIKYLDAANFPARRNLLRYTADFNSWTKSFISATQDGTIAPDGTTSGVWLLSKTDTSSSRYVQISFGTPTQTQLTVSMYFRAGSTNNRVTFGIYQNSAWSVGSNPKVISGPGSISLDSGISRATVTGLSATEWTKVSFTAGASTSGVASLLIYPAGTGNGVVGQSVYAYAPQVEYGSVVTDYQPVGATWSANPDADPTQEFPQETWIVDRKSLETKQVIEFELSSPFDRPGSFLPARQIIPNCCNWVYRKEGCGYTGGPVADEKDVPTTDLAKDKCSHSLTGCKLRYGADGVLPYGGEPTAGAYR